jgi:hypothetical protein
MTNDRNGSIAMPPVVRNWVLRRHGQPAVATYEYPIYTDAHIISEATDSDSPYSFLNPITLRNEAGLVQAAVIVRADIHLQMESPDFSKTETSTYHGGWLNDELAALMSLCTGARMRSGGISRMFSESEGPKGRPVSWDFRATPILNLDKGRLVLPLASGTVSLVDVQRTNLLMSLTTTQATALIKAARLYQDALWLAESEPSLGWLMMVSALEVAANQWRSEDGESSERLSQSHPEMAARLEGIGGAELLDFVASQIVPTLGATKKFVEFTLEYLPPPPDARPMESARISWGRTAMRKTLSRVYGYRSLALHGGTPFPAPMCERAFRSDGVDGVIAYVEKGTLGLAAHSTGGTWLAEDLPISLHTFNYIVRNTLIRWWEGMAISPNFDVEHAVPQVG